MPPFPRAPRCCWSCLFSELLVIKSSSWAPSRPRGDGPSGDDLQLSETGVRAVKRNRRSSQERTEPLLHPQHGLARASVGGAAGSAPCPPTMGVSTVGP